MIEEKKIIPKPRYNWGALKLEFLQGPFITTMEFRRFKKMPSSQNYFYPKMVGWGEEKKQLLALAAKKAAGDLVENKVDELRKVRERQAKLARLMQLKGAKGLTEIDVKTVDDSRKLLISGLQEERSSLGINEKGGTQPNLTQVNVNLPKTRFDEMLDGQDLEGLLKLITSVRRQRTLRTGTSIVEEGETEIK